jgi:hypothetical protein
MAERYLDVIHPSPEQLRQWGYDEDLYLTSQDEDLLLHDVAYLPALIELAADSNCPKQFYAASIAYTYSQLCVLHKRRAEVEAIRTIVEAAPPDVDPLVVEWRDDFRWICDRLQHPRALSADEVGRLAWGLLVGRYCTRDLVRTGLLLHGHIEFLASTISFRAYLYIDARSGDWQYAHFEPLKCSIPGTGIVCEHDRP